MTSRFMAVSYQLSAISLLLFLTLAGFQLALPGLNYDEALDVVPAMQLLLGQPVESLRGSGLRIAGHTLPLMIMDYKGVVHTYWALPFLWALGVNVFALRLSCLFLSLLTLAFTFRFVRQLYGPQVAVFTLLLLAVNPSFLFWSRQGVLWTTAMLTCGMGALAAFADWRREGRTWGLYGGVLLLGIGLSAKLLFLWFPLALAVSAILLKAKQLWAARRRAIEFRVGGLKFQAPSSPPTCNVQFVTCSLRKMATASSLALLALLLGLLPLLLYNLQTTGTLDVLLRNLRTSYYGVDNLAYLANMRLRWDHLRALLNGSALWYLGGPHRVRLFPLAFWLSAGAISACCLGRAISRPWDPSRDASSSGDRTRRWLRDALLPVFPLLMTALMVLQSAVTVSGLWTEHYLLLLPFPQLTVALGLDVLRRHLLRLRWSVVWIPRLVLALLIVGQLRVDLLYHRALARSGGFSAHSDANYKLAQYLDRKGRPVVAMDWGIKAPVQFLTQGRVNPVERFGFQDLDHPSSDFATGVVPYLGDRDTYYIFHAPVETVYRGRRDVFQELVRQRGLVPDDKRIIYDRSARPLFVVMEVDEP